MNNRFVPSRTCIACRKSDGKGNFLRIVKDQSGNIYLDVSGKAQGRGAYVCNSDTCLKKVVDKKLLAKHFGITVEQETYDKLKQDYEKLKG
jgi:hypothetical protein